MNTCLPCIIDLRSDCSDSCRHGNAESNIHNTAIVHPNAKLGKDVVIGPGAVIGENVEIGDGTQIGANVVIGGWTTIGKRCESIQVHPLVGPQDLKFKARKVIVT